MKDFDGSLRCSIPDEPKKGGSAAEAQARSTQSMRLMGIQIPSLSPAVISPRGPMPILSIARSNTEALNAHSHMPSCIRKVSLRACRGP